MSMWYKKNTMAMNSHEKRVNVLNTLLSISAERMDLSEGLSDIVNHSKRRPKLSLAVTHYENPGAIVKCIRQRFAQMGYLRGKRILITLPQQKWENLAHAYATLHADSNIAKEGGRSLEIPMIPRGGQTRNHKKLVIDQEKEAIPDGGETAHPPKSVEYDVAQIMNADTPIPRVYILRRTDQLAPVGIGPKLISHVVVSDGMDKFTIFSKAQGGVRVRSWETFHSIQKLLTARTTITLVVPTEKYSNMDPLHNGTDDVAICAWELEIVVVDGWGVSGPLSLETELKENMRRHNIFQKPPQRATFPHLFPVKWHASWETLPDVGVYMRSKEGRMVVGVMFNLGAHIIPFSSYQLGRNIDGTYSFTVDTQFNMWGALYRPENWKPPSLFPVWVMEFHR